MRKLTCGLAAAVMALTLSAPVAAATPVATPPAAASQSALTRLAQIAATKSTHFHPTALSGQMEQATAPLRRAIDGSGYSCTSVTPLTAWYRTTLTAEFKAAAAPMMDTGAFSVPMVDALMFGHESRSATFGVHGEFTSQLNRTMHKLRSFWDIPGEEIELVALHGREVFMDESRSAKAFELLGWDAETAAQLASETKKVMVEVPSMRGGDHPAFTFNAMAWVGDDPDPMFDGVGKKILMGDGILEGQAAVGNVKVGAPAVLAHEYAHQVQFVHDLFATDITDEAEATRRTELMADAFASYFLTHKKGSALNKHDVLQDKAIFFNVGDCRYDNPGHHGTPEQRAAAAAWGIDQAAMARPKSYVMPTPTLAARFEKVLPTLVA